MYALILILVDTGRQDELVQAWSRVGVGGLTIVDSCGIGSTGVRDEAQALFMGFSRLFHGDWEVHKTVMAVVPTLAMAEAAVAASEEILGNLDLADNGVAFLLPVVKSWGLGAKSP
jgi:hypothetical protein